MNNRLKIFGLNYDKVTLDEAVERIEGFIKERRPHMVFTTGAELIVRASLNKELKEIYLNSDLLTIDSNVVYLTSRLLKNTVLEPVSAVNLMFRFLELKSHKGYRLYFLGAKDAVLKRAIDNLKKRYPNINIVGWQHGYFNFDDDSEIIKRIIQAQPDVLFVAMSTPLKEQFINKNLIKMNVPVVMGVGGSIDIASGYYKLAPRWISRVGLEWFYRLIQEPQRLWRRYLVTNFMFMWLVIKELIKKDEKDCIG